MSLWVIFIVFVVLWGFTGTRYYTEHFPASMNPFKEQIQNQVSIFPDENPKANLTMLNFLRTATAKDHSLTAELRIHENGDDLLQRYPDLQIPTIHGWSNFRPLRAHLLYLWMLDDLRQKSPKKYDLLMREGGFSYNYGSRFDRDLLNLMGVRYLITEKGDGDERFETVAQGEKYKIYENKDAFPRIFLADQVKVLDTVEALGDYLRQQPSEILRKAVVFWRKDLGDNIDLLSASQKHSVWKAHVIRFTPNEVVIETETDGPSLLVMTQSFHPGWRATLNGKKRLPIYPAYYAFNGTPVPAGKNRVTFTFSDAKFVMSLYVAGGALLCLMVLIVHSWVKTR